MISLDYSQRAVVADGVAVRLTKFEFKLCDLLAKSNGAVVEYQEIIAGLWPSVVQVREDDMKNVRVLVSRIRGKLGDGAIQTVQGWGYRMNVAEQPKCPTCNQPWGIP